MARTLSTKLLIGATIVNVSPIFDRSDFPENGVIQIEDELIRYNNTTGDSFVECTRGYLGTTAAAHAAGVEISLYTSVPEVVEENSSLELLSPAILVADVVNNTDVINISTIAPDSLSLTLPSPSNVTVCRIISVCHKTGSFGTLEINGANLEPGEYKPFIWDGAAWSEIPTSGGGGGLSNPLTEDLDLGTFNILNATDIQLSGSIINTNGGLYLTTNSAGTAALSVNGDGSIVAYNQQDAPFVINGSNNFDQLQITGSSLGLWFRLKANGGGDSYLGSGNSLEMQVQSGPDFIPAAKFDGSGTANETRLFVYDVNSATLQRVTVGATNSGGSGFRLLRIPN